MNQKKGARLALKLSLTVVIPIFLITIAGILLSAYKQSNLSEGFSQTRDKRCCQKFTTDIFGNREGTKSLS